MEMISASSLKVPTTCSLRYPRPVAFRPPQEILPAQRNIYLYLFIYTALFILIIYLKYLYSIFSNEELYSRLKGYLWALVCFYGTGS